MVRWDQQDQLVPQALQELPALQVQQDQQAPPVQMVKTEQWVLQDQQVQQVRMAQWVQQVQQVLQVQTALMVQ